MKGNDTTKQKRKSKAKSKPIEQDKPAVESQTSSTKSEIDVEKEKETSVDDVATPMDALSAIDNKSEQIIEINKSEDQFVNKDENYVSDMLINNNVPNEEAKANSNTDYVNPRGVRFVQDSSNSNPTVPYGLPCIRELLRFLISLINT
jgi:hypothetical protein